MSTIHRRKSDQWQYRAAIALMILTSVLCLANSFVSAYAIHSINRFNTILDKLEKASERMHGGMMSGPGQASCNPL